MSLFERLLSFLNKLYPYKAVLIIPALVFIGVIVYSFINLPPAQQNSVTVPSFLGLAWSVLLFFVVTFSNAYGNNRQLNRESSPSLLQRLKIKLLQCFFLLFGFLLIGISLAIIFFTYRIIMLN